MKVVRATGNILWNVIPARYILAILGSIGMAIVYGLKVNLSVAMVGMLNHTALKKATPDKLTGEPECADFGDQESGVVSMNDEKVDYEVDREMCVQTRCYCDILGEESDGPFVWGGDVQGLILSCYFWGYFVSQIPGGRVAEVFSAKWVMFFSVTVNVVCTLLTPPMAESHYAGVIVMRIGEGIGGGVTFPAMHVLLSKWAPPAERSVMAALVYAGTSLGTVMSMLMAGGLTVAAGWASVFYVMGGLSCIWCVLWVFLVQDSPQQQRIITQEERDMIVESLGNTEETSKKKMPVPWKSVFTSAPFLAILVAHTCSNWGWYMLLIELPFYMKQVLKFNMAQNTVTTAMPFLSLWLFSMILSKTLDTLREKGKISTTAARKFGTLFASAVPAVCMLSLCFVGCSRTAAVALMAIAVTSIGGMFCGFLSNHIDIAPNFAGTLMAITNTVATIPGIIVPIFVGHITDGNQTISAWRVIFFVTIGLYIIEIVVYTIYGSGEQQPWNNVTEESQDRNDSKRLKADVN